MPLYDDADEKLARMQFPEVTKLPEPLVAGFVGALIGGQAFGFMSGASYRQQIVPAVVAGVVTGLGVYLASRRRWTIARTRYLAQFVMVILITFTAGVAGHLWAPFVLFRLAFDAAPAGPIQFIKQDPGTGMTSPALLVMKTDKPSLDLLLEARQFTPLSEVQRIPSHLAAYLSPQMQADQFRVMLADAREFANELPMGANTVIVERTIPGSWETFWERRVVRVIWDPATSLAHVLISYPDASDSDD